MSILRDLVREAEADPFAAMPDFLAGPFPDDGEDVDDDELGLDELQDDEPPELDDDCDDDEADRYERGLELSRSLLAELSTLVRASYVRHLRDVEDADGHVVLAAGELVRADVMLLAEWWRDNGGLLVESHRAHAARHLSTLGVPT